MQYLRQHVVLVALVGAVLLLSLVPLVESRILIGASWQGVVPVYMDEYIYYAYISEAATGNLFFGHPYFLEHRFDPPLFLSGSVALGSLPLILGLPLSAAIPLAFAVWSVVFVLLCYRLLRELVPPSLWSAGGAFFAYLACYDQVYRIGVRQEVYPFLLLFYIALVRVVAAPTRWRSVLLGAAAGVSFYLYGFLWQTVVVTLVLAFAYAVVVRQWALVRALAASGALAGGIAAPALLYALWVSGQPYFWESLNRYGLVETHLPVMEVIYSGGWVGIALVVLGILYWRIQEPRVRAGIALLALTGASICIVQGSNVLSGKLLEQGDHLRRFITLWLPLAVVCAGYYLIQHRSQMQKLYAAAGTMLGVLACAGLYFAAHHTHPFTQPLGSVAQWHTQQTYAPVLRWLDAHEPEPVVVWSNPHSFATVHIPVYTRHYVLYLEAGELALMSNKEIEERYLVSSYFDPVGPEYLKKNMEQYVGRAHAYHLPQTKEREYLVCRVFHLGDTSSCTTPKSSQELLGDAYFSDLTDTFAKEIQPNIREYLKKYHVSYVLKDLATDKQYYPEELGGVVVYADDHFELYKLP